MAALVSTLTSVNDGQVIGDNNTRLAITALKAAITAATITPAAAVASVNITTIATTQATFLQQTVDDLINKLRTAGIVT